MTLNWNELFFSEENIRVLFCLILVVVVGAVGRVGASDEWYVDLAFFLNLGKLRSYAVFPL
jgi:hypothetical protein